VNTEVLSNLLGKRIKNLTQEVPHMKKKIDICGTSEGSVKNNIFVEVQLIPADLRHMDTVKKILNDVDQGIVVWEALTFYKRQHLIEEILLYAKGLSKPVDFIVAEINPKVIPVLEELILLFPLDVVPNLNRLAKVREPLKVIAQYKGRDLSGGKEQDGSIEAHSLIRQGILEPVALTSRLGANTYVLEKIRTEMPYYTGGYRAKSRLDTNAIAFGAGDGNAFEISVRANNYSHIKLRIARKNESTFVKINRKKIMFENMLGYKINFKEERSSYIIDTPILGFGRPMTEVLDEVVEVFKRFVNSFTEYFYRREEKRKRVGAM